MSDNEDMERMLKSAMMEEQPKRKLKSLGRPPGAQNKFTRSLREAMLAGS
jgi:hypothetical protein